MANYDLTYEGSRVQGILDTGNSLKDAGYIFRGEATPSTVPGTPTERVAYIGGPGTYTNFGSSITVGAGCICVFKYTGSAWSNQVINTGLDSAVNTLQNAINTINSNIGNGYVYAGVATPSTSPVTGKVFYIAVQAGTYTNFGNAVVTAGLNVIKYNGSAWSVDQVIAIDAEPTQGSANLVKSGGVLNSIIQNGSAFDLSAYNAQGGVLATYADLSAALTALNALPADFKKGGMSMKFVLTYDNKYVQYRLMTDEWSITPSDWQGVDEVPTSGSVNLVTSNGVALQNLAALSQMSVRGKVYIHKDHLVSTNAYGFVGYNENTAWDAGWILIYGGGVLTITGATIKRVIYFNDLVISSDTFISNKTTNSHVIPSGAKLAIINFQKDNNPDGYNSLFVTQPYMALSKEEIERTYVNLSAQQDITNKTYNGYTLGGACEMGKDTTFNNQDETKVATQKAISDYIEDRLKEYKTSPYMIDINLGKNLIDPNNVLNGYIIDNDILVEATGGVMSNPLFFEYGKTYAISGIMPYFNTGRFIIQHCDAWGNQIAVSRINSENITLDADGYGTATYQHNILCYYSRIVLCDGVGTNIFNKDKAQIEVGNTATTFENFKGIYKDTGRREIKIFAIGSSYTMDALSYMPALMKNIEPNVDIILGALYLSGSSLPENYENFNNDSPVYMYWKYDYKQGKYLEEVNNVTIKYGLDDEKWDIILFGQGSGQAHVENYMKYYVNPLNGLIKGINTYINYPVKMGFVEYAIRPRLGGSENPVSTKEEVTQRYNAAVTNIKHTYEMTLVDFVIPVGTAVQMARNTSLDNIGLGVMMTKENVHLQAGVPCQLAGYTACISILKIMAAYNEKSVWADRTVVNSSWEEKLSPPNMSNTTYPIIVTTESSRKIIQACAIMANKFPLEPKDLVTYGIVDE